jgi:3-hydroxyisobutyrate dehydrogenase
MKVSVLGIGLMGEQIALRLLGAGHAVTGYNRTAGKTSSLEAHGAAVAGTPAAAVLASEVTLLMLTDGAAIEAVVMSDEVRQVLHGKTLIQMGTIASAESLAFQARIESAGGSYLEAPVLGSVPNVKAGTLKVLAGSTVEQYERWAGLLGCLGTVVYVGEVGSAAAMKLARNQLIAALICAYGLSLKLVESKGLSTSTFLEMMRGDALSAPILEVKAPAMLQGSYPQASFSIQNLLKDVELFLAEAKQANLDSRSLDGARDILNSCVEAGWAGADYSAIYAVIGGPARKELAPDPPAAERPDDS